MAAVVDQRLVEHHLDFDHQLTEHPERLAIIQKGEDPGVGSGAPLAPLSRHFHFSST